ncbi:phosphoglycerate mutase-like protein [Peniophora sp. CONT]|nr:phosphoglycerate mutase-like protein [Peniophora sp. CONT]
MAHSNVHGVVVLTRNGDRFSYSQDPYTYESSWTEATPLGEVQSHQLGQALRTKYFTPSSPSYISNVHTDLVDPEEIQARYTAGGEVGAVFDSATATLQALFPPNEKNSIELSDGTKVVAPLGGYQYVHLETVVPAVDRALEGWTGCPKFEEHVKKVYDSPAFDAAEQASKRFFAATKDFLFGRPSDLIHAVNVYDYITEQNAHNRTFAYRLPPTYVEQARHWANVHEELVFGDAIGGIGNVAGRSALGAVVSALDRVAFDGDRAQFVMLAGTYQPFVSLFNMTGIESVYGIPDFASALAIELRRAPLPDSRDFLRFMFRNGSSGTFEPVHVFGHDGDIPLTEFVFRTRDAAITTPKEWMSACGASGMTPLLPASERASVHTQAAMLVGAALFAALLLIFAAVIGRRWPRKVAGKGIVLPEDVDALVWREEKGARVKDGEVGRFI